MPSDTTDDQPLPFWFNTFTGIMLAFGATPFRQLLFRAVGLADRQAFLEALFRTFLVALVAIAARSTTFATATRRRSLAYRSLAQLTLALSAGA